MRSIMLLGYCISTGNSIVERALKAITLVVCVFHIPVTGNVNRIPRQRRHHHERQTASQRKIGVILRWEKKSPQIWVS